MDAPLTFKEINDMFNRARANGMPEDVTYQQFAQFGGQVTGRPEFQQIAQSGNFGLGVRRFNEGIDNVVNAVTPNETLGKWTGGAFEALGGTREFGEAVGSDIPRMALDAAPMLAGTAIGGFLGSVLPGPGTLAGAAAGAKVGMWLSGALMALNAYGDTGELGQAVLAGASPKLGSMLYSKGANLISSQAARSPLLQGLGFTGGQAATRATTTGAAGEILPIGSTVTQNFLNTGRDKALAWAGGQTAVNTGFLGLDVLTQGTDQVMNRDYLLANLVGNSMFLPMDLHGMRGPVAVGKKTYTAAAEADPIFTPQESRLEAFKKIYAGANSEAARSQMRQDLGFDIATAAQQRQSRASTIAEFRAGKKTAESLLNANWTTLREANPGLPDLPTALADPDIIKAFPVAAESLNRYKKDMSDLTSRRKAQLRQNRGLRTDVETLFGVATEDLKLPTTLLSKPLVSTDPNIPARSLADYQAALKGRVTPKMQKILFDTHRVQAGLEPTMPELWQKHVGKPTEESRADMDESLEVLGAVNAGSKTPLSDQSLGALAKQLADEGRTPDEIANALVGVLRRKATNETRPKSPGRPKGRTQVVTDRIESTRQMVDDFTAGKIKLEANEEAELGAIINELERISEGNEANRSDLMNVLGGIWSSPNKEGRLARFKKAASTTMSRKKGRTDGIEFVPLEERNQIDDNVNQPQDEEILEQFDPINIEELADTIIDVDDGTIDPIDPEPVTDAAAQVQQEILSMTRARYPDLTDTEILAKLHDLPEEAKLVLKQVAMKNLGVKLAGVEGTDINLQQAVPLEVFGESILSKLGFTEIERKALMPSFIEMAKMFESPEVKYGTLSEEGQLARVAEYGPVYAAAMDRLRQVFLNPERLSTVSKKDQANVMASLLAHENSHILAHKAKLGEFGPRAQELFLNYENWIRNADVESVQDVMDVMKNLYLSENTRKAPGVEDVINNIFDKDGNISPDEVMANLIGTYATGMYERGNSGKDAMLLLPGPMRKAFDWIGGKLQSAWDAARIWGKLGGDSEKIGRANDVAKIFAEVRNHARQAEEQMLETKRLFDTFNPGTPLDMSTAQFAMGAHGSKGKVRASAERIFDNWIMKGADHANNYEFLKVPYDNLVTTQNKVSTDIAQSLASIFGDTGLVNKGRLKDGDWKTVQSSESLSKFRDEVVYWANQQKKSMVVQNPNGSTSFDVNSLSPQLRGRLQQFTHWGQKAVSNLIVKMEKSMEKIQRIIVENTFNEHKAKMAKIISHDPSMVGKFGIAQESANKIMEAVRGGNPADVQIALATLPDVALQARVLDLATSFNKMITGLEQGYANSRWFGSLRRYGPIKQRFHKGSDEQLLSFRDAAEAEREVKKLADAGWAPGKITYEENSKGNFAVDHKMKELVREREEEIGLKIDALPLPQSVRDALRADLDITSSIEKAIAAKDVSSLGIKRDFRKGFENMDMLEQHMLFANAAIKQSHMKRLNAEIAHQIEHPDGELYHDAKENFKQRFENFKAQTPEFLNKLSKANAAWFIGFNIPGHFAELAQPLVTHVPELKKMGLGYTESVKLMGGIQKDIMGFYTKRLQNKVLANKSNVDIWDAWPNKAEADMLRENVMGQQNLLASGFSDIGFSQGQLLSAMERGKGMSPAEMAKAPFRMLADTSLGLYGKFTQHNDIAGLLSGYRAAIKAGKPHEQAVMDARMFNGVVNKGGGKASRQVTPYSGNGLIGHVAYALQGYTTGWFGQLATYYRHGFKPKDYPNLTPGEVKNAKSAFKTMVLAQLGAGGLMGFPFFAAGMRLMESLLGEELQSKVYDAVNEVAGDSLIAETATHGAASSVTQALGIPVDLHSRFSLGGIAGFNSYDGYNVNSLVGPVASMINGTWKMGKSLVQGEGPRAALAAGGPSGIKNIAKAFDEDLQSPGGMEASTADMVLTGLGFRGVEQRKERELQSIATNLNKYAAAEMTRSAQVVLKAMDQGPEIAQQTLMAETGKLLSDIPDSPGFNELYAKTLKSLADKVSSTLEERLMPKDLRELGTSRTNPQIENAARNMGVPIPPSMEVQREMLRQSAYQALGIARRPNTRAATRRDLERQQEQLSY